ncbi:PTS fructose transporter subunit IIA [Paracidovorax citrulli]|uniref:PTS system fructose subfamily IIA component n=2 Tax=Paracidovorax citrulli TaxID=80869 RepID=A1TJ21_PARC0|nr:PTS fructose transporter subunit IIA [Paracidovorax citrulli]ABM30959.1 PTS system fructose subfamily IIA component [Paracidovorax citrulli AAC00-1]ATG95876.1 PTS fructose transporter subunit IIA [Paracidovorax citrulli]MVT29697.1 PTS fructose transporter subunit IIA [Paracidovorax citrulli]PVY65136.1 PTS system ascorbate-specific IIA component [Paracidovorax citrulli]REG70674.1 PTS system ascorbate-specific IIA component [Paracidovorax citrulli]
MSTRILLIAHAPLAHALRACALHVFPDTADDILALDVHPNAPPEDTLAAARILLDGAGGDAPILVLTDVFGATPCNVAQRLVDGERSRLVTGVNLPMLLRAVSYRREPLEALVARAIAGGTQGVMQVAVAAPQNQTRRSHHDQDEYHHQQ